MAIIKEWESSKEYDKELSKIEHYKLHPELMPFIGTNYKKAGVLLVGESHYINQTIDNIKYDNSYFLNHWWNGTHKDISNEPFSGWYNTRGVINNYLDGKRSKGHSIFTNLVKAFSECILGQKIDKISKENSQAFHYFAFMNFFQMPSLINGEKYWKSLYASNASNPSNASELWNVCINISAKVLDEVIDILNPIVVVFSSVSAYDAYKESEHNHIHNSLIKSVPHAGCKWWNKKCKKYGNISGKELFIDILTKANTIESVVQGAKE